MNRERLANGLTQMGVAFDAEALDRFEALKLNEISKPYQEAGQWRILYRVPVPKASYKGQQWRIRIRLEKERLGDAWSSLHEESGLKLNFAVPDIGM